MPMRQVPKYQKLDHIVPSFYTGSSEIAMLIGTYCCKFNSCLLAGMRHDIGPDLSSNCCNGY